MKNKNNTNLNDLDQNNQETNTIEIIKDLNDKNNSSNTTIKKNLNEANINNINNNNVNSNNLNFGNKFSIELFNNFIEEKKAINNEEETQYIIYSEIKKYLSLEEDDNSEYSKMIQNNPEKIFEIIDQGTLMHWESILFNFEATDFNSDDDILKKDLNRKDEQIIYEDSRRTRYRESHLLPDFVNILEKIISFYCSNKNIDYKQGLNEIFGCFILMKYKIKNLKLVNIYNLGEAFIDKFLSNYYYEKELFSLKSSISLFSLLLKYHEPTVFNYLDSLEISHELFSTNWILTLMAQKLNLDILYNLWDNIIRINDPLFIHFILVAMIKYKRELVINCSSNFILKMMTKLAINTIEELNHVVKIALELRSNTPYSYRFLSNQIGFLKTNNKNIKQNLLKYKLDLIPSIPIFPTEILYDNYINKIICPDIECLNYPDNQKKNNNHTRHNNKINHKYNKKSKKVKKEIHICEKCDMKIKKSIEYKIIDLRLFSSNLFKNNDEYFKMGFLSGTMFINREQLISDNIGELLSSLLLSIRGKNHIILMTQKTDYFSEFEEKYYFKEQKSILSQKKIMFGVKENKKTEKKLNMVEAQNLSMEEIYKLKEYDIFRKIIISLKKHNFPYISYLEGGFETLHNLSIKYGIDLVEHNKKKCKLCKQITIDINKNPQMNEPISIKDELWKKNKIITENQLNSFFKDKNNIVFICNLCKYKNRFFNKRDIEFYVVILFDRNVIEIYKNDSKNKKNYSEYELYNINYYDYNFRIKENKKEKSKNNFILRLFDDIQFKNIQRASFDNKSKNIILMKINKNDDQKDNEKGKLSQIEDFFEIEFVFCSVEESKIFMNSIKKIDIAV